MDLVDLTTEYKSSSRSFRVSTKYPALVRQHFRKFGIYYYQLIHSDGALELHPSLGIADIIVDLTSSGTTLKDNRLREIEGGTVLESAACMIGHRPSLARLIEEGDSGPLALLFDAIDGVRDAENWLHLEVVGTNAGEESPTGELIADHLRDKADCTSRAGKVEMSTAVAGWHVTALFEARRLTAVRRALFRLGASRVVGLASRFVYDRGMPSTYDDLCGRLKGGADGQASGTDS